MNSSVHIQTGVREGITFLKESYFTPPFKIANITEDRSGKDLDLMIMCSSPGILDGDENELVIELDEASRLNLFTQSYQRLFPMENGAMQSTTVHMNKNASLTYLPHPVVPHKDSIFKAKNKIFLTSGCQLIWGEVITCGRKLKNEIFSLSQYQNLTEVYFNNVLTIKENLLLKPSLKRPEAMGQLEIYTHQASLIYWNEKRTMEPLILDVLEFLREEIGVESGATMLPGHGMMVRILGTQAEQLHNCLKKIAVLIQNEQLPKSLNINSVIYAD